MNFKGYNKALLLLTLVIGLSIVSTGADALTVRAIYAGYMTSYAVADNGTLWVWGEFDGQTYAHPVMVQTIDHVAMVAPGVMSPAILKDDGTVWTLESTMAKNDFVKTGISGVRCIASGGGQFYAIKNDGSLWAWGDNRDGGLGNPDVKEITVEEPIKVPLGNVSLVLPKGGYTYARTEDGTWRAWGENRFYELNDGTNERRYAPVHVPIDSDTIIAPGSTENVLALRKDGTVWTWGCNAGGQAGDPVVPTIEVTADNKVVLVPIKSPLQVPGMSDVIEIGSSGETCVALKKDGTVWTWGQDHKSFHNDLGNLDSNRPVQVTGLENIVAIVTGVGHFFAIRSDGMVWAWGYDYSGQLGDGQILNVLGGSCGMPIGVRVTDLYVKMPYKTSMTQVVSAPATIPIPVPTPTPAPAASASPTTSPAASATPEPTSSATVSPTPVPLPAASPDPMPGLVFNAIALLGCICCTANLLSWLVRRKGK